MPTPSLPRQYARTRRFTLGAPGHVTVSADGRTVFFLRSRAGDDPVSCLWALEVASGTERLLADPAVLLGGAAEDLPAQERARRERVREMSAGIVEYAADEAGDLIAFALSGQLWTVRAGSGEPVRLPVAGPVFDPRPDPTGARIAYVSGGALRVVESDGGSDRPVAQPDGADVSFGLAEHVAAEEMHRPRGYWWAPDGRRLLVARVDASPVQVWYISDPADPARAPTAIRYPAAGTANADVTLWIAGAALSEGGPMIRVDWDTAGFEYLTAAGWDGFGPYAAVQDRSQRHVQVLGIDHASGATSVLAEQRDEAWVHLVPGLPARAATGELLTSSDSADTRHLAIDGRPVTPPGLQLEEVLAVDGQTVLFTASADPAQSHLWTYHPDSGLTQVTSQTGMHTGTRRGGTTVVISQALDNPGTQTLAYPADAGRGEHRATQRDDAAGQATGKTTSGAASSGAASSGAASSGAASDRGHGPIVIVSHAERPVLDCRPRLLVLGPRELRAVLLLPSWHGPDDGPLPVLMDPYGGPAMRKVVATRTHHVSQWFAEQGFAVLVADGAGTPGRGPAWEREIYLDLAGPVLADQIEALTRAAELHPVLDLTRVAIRGWSFGGYLAALAVLRRPDVFHAAIAGAPVTDQLLYDTHWRERHLGHPQEHPEAYERCSPIREAASLTRPLLLVHGLADDNVVPAHTLRFSAALLAAGRPHEVLPLPRTTHMPLDEAVAENLLLHQLDFLRRALGLPRPPSGAR